MCIALLALTACTVAQDAADVVARDRAKAVVNDVVASRFPGVDASPVTDCIIDAASAQELVSIASAAVTGVTDETVRTILQIAQRPDAVQCIAATQIGSLFG